MTISMGVTNLIYFNKKQSVKLRGMFLHFSSKANTVSIVNSNWRRLGSSLNLSLYDGQKSRSTKGALTSLWKYNEIKYWMDIIVKLLAALYLHEGACKVWNEIETNQNETKPI